MNILNSIKKIFSYFKDIDNEVTKESDDAKEQDLVAESKPESKLHRYNKQWMGVDLDGTLAYYDSMSTIDSIGRPIQDMRDLVLKMIKNGIRVKIFTARAQDPDQIPMIEKWLRENGFPPLEITNVKNYGMQRLYDDRCIQVEKNTGRLIVED